MPTLKLNRRNFTAGLLATPFVARSVPALAQSLQEISYITPFGHSVVYAPDYVAATSGLFEKNGLKVNIIGGTGSAAAVQQLVAGQVQVARTGGIDIVRAIANSDAPIRAIATVSQSSTWHIISSQDAPINTPEELAGKTVGIVSAGGGSEDTVDIVLAGAGIPKEEVRRQVVGNSPGAFDLVKLGRIDAFICDLSVVSNLRAIDAPMAVMQVDPFVAIPGQAYIATQETIDNHGDMLLGYLRSAKEAIQAIEADTDGQETLKLMEPFDFPELRDPDTALASLRAEQQVWLSKGSENVLRIYPEVWEEGWAQMAAAGIVEAGDASRAYTTVFSEQL
ncbi:ABC transporter substrate-binding protein [Chelativorans sp. Marseille-P2723]|uniref:ABC transporter substrate-binding protein n=1 Tax=Chelativorans sp. Marseille-P2723 TaxID=2709133 RepID=UPI00156DE21A|nr:ABC transporter substrate-binding protein [Chelativorans sp. Marseille-P2723]